MMIFLAFILLIANIALSFNEDKEYKKQDQDWNVYEGEIIVNSNNNNSNELIVNDEKQFMNNGKIIANEQKIKILNNRIENVEKVVSEIVKHRVLEDENSFDYEKIDFRIKVLEKEIDNIKNPIIHKKTFFGKENDKMEKKIKALAFNSSKK